jgi:hypothetical protein
MSAAGEGSIYYIIYDIVTNNTTITACSAIRAGEIEGIYESL